MDDALKVVVKQGMERKYGRNPNKAQAARDCDVPYHALIAVLTGHVKRPAPEILDGLSQGLDVDYDALALAAYGRLPSIRRDESDVTESLQNEGSPPETNAEGQWGQPAGARRKQATVST